MNRADQTRPGRSLLLKRLLDAIKSTPGTIGALGGATAVLAGALAFFWPAFADRLHPPQLRNGTVSNFVLEEQITLKDYLAFMDASGMANSIADAPHSEAEKRQIGRHVQFRVEVAGYVSHRCEIDYGVVNASGSTIIPHHSLIAFYPKAQRDGGTFDVWVPRADRETLNVAVFDDSPRPPGHMLVAQPQVIDWKS